MAIYERTEDNKFVYTQINQKEIDVLNLAAYAGFWLFPEKLQIAANGGMNRCFNFGNDYTHCHTSWVYIGSIVAYLGNFTLRGYIDNGNSFLEGETKNCQGAYSVLQASYNRKVWCFSLSWANPLQSDYKSLESKLQNRNLTCFLRNLGNMVSLNISWNLSRGKTRRSDESRTTLQDTDNGIMK